MATRPAELRLWQDMNVTQRALRLRDHADMFWLMTEMQHGRITGWDTPECFDAARTQLVRQRLDVDLFMMAMNRLLAVTEITEKTADPRNLMPAAMTRFATEQGLRSHVGLDDVKSRPALGKALFTERLDGP